MQQREFVHVSDWKKWRAIGGAADDTLNLCVAGDPGYETTAATQTEHLG